MLISNSKLIYRLCSLCNKVAREIVNFPENPADCFCSTTPITSFQGFLFDVRIIEFIEQAVNMALIIRQNEEE